jgi:hypothetical protein
MSHTAHHRTFRNVSGHDNHAFFAAFQHGRKRVKPQAAFRLGRFWPVAGITGLIENWLDVTGVGHAGLGSGGRQQTCVVARLFIISQNANRNENGCTGTPNNQEFQQHAVIYSKTAPPVKDYFALPHNETGKLRRGLIFG